MASRDPAHQDQVPNTRFLNRLYTALLFAAMMAMGLLAATFWVTAQNQEDETWVGHTLEVRNQLNVVLDLVQRAESGQRGYLLTGRDGYLVPFETAGAELPKSLGQARDLVSDNLLQQQALAQLRQLIDEKLKELRATVEDRRSGRAQQALDIVNTDEGERLMGQITKVVASMQREEDRLLADRRAGAAASRKLIEAGASALFLLILGIAALLVFFSRRAVWELTAAHGRVTSANRELLEQISRREAAEGQLRQAQKMEAIGRLTGGIAHDFNNMLAVITGSLELMQRRIENGDAKIERFLDAARKGADRASALTQRLLAFARRQPLAPEAIDANTLLGNMSDLLRASLGEHIRTETVLAAGLWSSHADAHQLESAILNVAINARDAMPRGGKLTLETANVFLDDAYCRQQTDVMPGQYVLVAITDTGTGMLAETAAHAFDPFFTTKPTGFGTGLGLSQVYGFVKQSRGHVMIYSEPGTGTTVKIYLPRLTDEKRQPEHAIARVASYGAKHEIVLLVEDDLLVRKLSAEALRELGYTVLESQDPADALNILDRTPEVTLLFTDVVMPGITGRQLAEEAVRRRPGLKVLYTTGYTQNAVVHGGVLDPGVEFIGKPFSLEQLATKVRAVLDAESQGQSHDDEAASAIGRTPYRGRDATVK